jgi:hypothetical protein
MATVIALPTTSIAASKPLARAVNIVPLTSGIQQPGANGRLTRPSSGQRRVALAERRIREYNSSISQFTISGLTFELERGSVEEAVAGLLPDPVREHYVVVRGRRFPPKQVISSVTGVDRADFTTHQARRILKRLGFVAARTAHAEEPRAASGGDGPHGGRQAEALAPFVGKWVALGSPTDVLVAADEPQEVLAWLARHERRAPYGMFRVPANLAEAEGAAPD